MPDDRLTSETYRRVLRMLSSRAKLALWGETHNVGQRCARIDVITIVSLDAGPSRRRRVDCRIRLNIS